MIDKLKVRDRLIRAWNKSGLTQIEIARKVGMSPTQLNGYMRGLYIPTVENLYKVCKECGVTMDEVLDGAVTYEGREE